MSKKIPDTAYGFALGRTRALEAQFLDRPRYDRLVRVASATDFRQALGDTPYAAYLGEAEVSVEMALERAARDNFVFFSNYCLDRWVVDAFRLAAFAHNQKVICRHRLLGTEPAPDELWPIADFIPDVRRWEQVCAQQTDPEEIDQAIDRLEQELVMQLCQPSRFLLGFFSLRADVRNLQTLVRCKLFGADRKVLERSLLPGGSLRPLVFLDLLTREWDLVLARFRFTPFRRMIEEGVDWVQQRSSMARMERLGREMELAYVKKARYITFGYEPLVGFYVYRENEITNLRQLYAAKRAGLDEEYCRELVAWVE